MKRLKTLSLKISAFCLLGFSLAPQTAFADNDLGLEAIVAPHFGLGISSQGARTYYGFDFHRISSNVSLLALYGYGQNYWDISGILRFSRQIKLFDESYSQGLYLGLGAGGSFSRGLPGIQTGTLRREPFTDIIFNPFIRYLFDFNGWQGLYLEAGYEYHHRLYHRKTTLATLKAPSILTIGIGIAFEAERSRD